tara:strand:+ start:553 stop:987 length:435 start_codon:yes stop_codon:yes gene_type:complete
MNVRSKALITTGLIAGMGMLIFASVAPAGGMGGGGMGRHGAWGAERETALTLDQVRTLSEAYLIMRGNENLKVGQVTAKDGNVALVQIVTKDDSLVKEVEINTMTGHPVKMEKHMRKRHKDKAWRHDKDDNEDNIDRDDDNQAS